MQALRLVVVLAVLGYAGWLAWPLVQPLLEGLPAGLIDGGVGPVPIVAIWAAAIVLYFIAAVMLGAGNNRAALAYFLGFVADVVVKLAIERGRPTAADASISSKSAGAESMGPMAAPAPVEEAAYSLGVEPVYLVIWVLLVLGLLVLVASRRRRRARTPGQLAG